MDKTTRNDMGLFKNVDEYKLLNCGQLHEATVTDNDSANFRRLLRAFKDNGINEAEVNCIFQILAGEYLNLQFLCTRLLSLRSVQPEFCPIIYLPFLLRIVSVRFSTFG